MNDKDFIKNNRNYYFLIHYLSLYKKSDKTAII